MDPSNAGRLLKRIRDGRAEPNEILSVAHFFEIAPPADVHHVATDADERALLAAYRRVKAEADPDTAARLRHAYEAAVEHAVAASHEEQEALGRAEEARERKESAVRLLPSHPTADGSKKHH